MTLDGDGFFAGSLQTSRSGKSLWGRFEIPLPCRDGSEIAPDSPFHTSIRADGTFSNTSREGGQTLHIDGKFVTRHLATGHMWGRAATVNCGIPRAKPRRFRARYIKRLPVTPGTREQ